MANVPCIEIDKTSLLVIGYIDADVVVNAVYFDIDTTPIYFFLRVQSDYPSLPPLGYKYDITNDVFFRPPATQQELIDELDTYTDTLKSRYPYDLSDPMNALYIPLSVDNLSILLSLKGNAENQSGSATRIAELKNSNFISFTNDQIIEKLSDISDYLQAIITAKKTTYDLIMASDPSIVFVEDVDASIDSLISSNTPITQLEPVRDILDTKVDKVTGKDLSTNDFTDADNAKLGGIATGATVNSSDSYLLDRSHHTGTQLAATISDFSTAADARITAQKGANNGLASLDSGGRVPSAQLPSYVDDVLEFANLAAMPATGETGKIYIALDTNREYRWSGSTYIQLVASPGTTDNVPEGTTNLYFTAARVLDTVLTGLSTATAAAVSATDTVLQAIGKLQAQITANKTRTTSTITPSFVGTGATGTQISATKPSSVRISATVTSTVAAILGGSTSVSTVTLKKCATNSATESDWVGVSIESTQTLTGALTLSSVQTNKGELTLDLDAGWFFKVVNAGSGTHSETMGYCEQTIYG